MQMSSGSSVGPAPMSGPVPEPRNRQPSSLSVVVPCYNEEQVVKTLVSRLSAAASEMGIPFELVLVDDGSRDSTWQQLRLLQRQYPQLKIVRLSGNRGQQAALTCGLDQARGEVVVIMDADLQDPPELIAQMITLWQKGYDVVYGQRISRAGETAAKRLFSHAYYRLFDKITGYKIPPDTGDFRLMDRRAVDSLQSLREKHRFIRGMASWIGFHQTPLRFDRPKRIAGETKFPFWKSFHLALDGFTSFSYAPLRAILLIGGALSLCSLLVLALLLLLALCGRDISPFTFLGTALFCLGGVQLLSLGLIGEYVGRTFEQSQGRPLYFIDEMHGDPLTKPQPSIGTRRSEHETGPS
jgi:glycosyltransferase involved in cell wall biosynthesis